MSLQISGLISMVLPIEKGLTKAGVEWQKQSFIIANNDGYEGKEQIFAFEVFGAEKVENFNKYNKVGDSVTVDFNINTNEYQGRYYTSLQSWKVSKVESVSKEQEQFMETNHIEQDDFGLPF